MESVSTEIEQFLAHSKKLREISKTKSNLESALAELTLFNNVAELAKKPCLFSTHVLSISYRVLSNSIEHSSSPQCLETLLISLVNVSEKFTFNPDYWQICISSNDDRTRCNWDLENSLKPGQTARFCCPLSSVGRDYCNLQKVSLAIKFVFHFDSKTFTKSFHVHECIIDILHCLDPGRCVSAFGAFSSRQAIKVSDLDGDNKKLTFPPVTMFLLKMDLTLKSRFLKEILLFDSLHRGFQCDNEELSSHLNHTVYFAGHEIEICLLKGDTVSIKCANPAVLCATKVAILRRLVSVNGILVGTLDEKYREQLQNLDLKLAAFQPNPSSITDDVDELMEYYLELRDITESVRFSVVNEVN